MSAEGRRILALLNRRFFAETGESGTPDAIVLGEGGRPGYQDRHADFNISHSRMMAAASYTTGGRTGCDIQYMDGRKDRRSVAARFFHPEEREALESAGEESRRLFYHLWTLKESWLKLRCLSIFHLEESPAFVFRGPKGEYFFRDKESGPPGDSWPPDRPLPLRGKAPALFLYETCDAEGNAYALAVCREEEPGRSVEKPEPLHEAPPEIFWLSLNPSCFEGPCRLIAKFHPS